MYARHLSYVPLVFLYALTVVVQDSAAAESFSVGADASRWNATSRLSYLDENDRELSLKDVLAPIRSEAFKPVSADMVNFGLRRAASWFRFTVTNPRQERVTLYVEVNNARIKRADFYAPGLPETALHQQSGTVLRFGDRTMPYRNPVFQLALDPGQEQTVYLRVYHRGSYRFKVLVWEYGAFISQHTLQTGLYGTFYGSLAIMFVYNMVLFVLFRDRSFFLLSTIILSVGLYMAVYQRLDAQFLWPDNPNIPGSRLNVLIGLGLCAGFFFSRDFLGTAGNAPMCDRVFRIYGVLSLFLCLDLVIGGLWSDWLMQGIGGTAPIVLMVGAVVRLRQGHRYAWGYIIIWGTMFATMIAFALLGAGVLPQHFLIEHGPKLAFPLGLALNSIGIWQRFRELQDQHTANLEVQVAERTHELSEALENVKTLHGLIPICSACKSVRNDEGFWIRVETYVRDNSEADFTHGICPECAMRLYNRKI